MFLLFHMTSKSMHANCDMLGDIQFWTTHFGDDIGKPLQNRYISCLPLQTSPLDFIPQFPSDPSNFIHFFSAPESEDCAQLQQWALVVWLSVTCFHSPVESLLTLGPKGEMIWNDVTWCMKMVQHTHTNKIHINFIANFKETHLRLKFGGGASKWHQPKKLKERCWMHCILNRILLAMMIEKVPYIMPHHALTTGFPARRWPWKPQELLRNPLDDDPHAPKPCTTGIFWMESLLLFVGSSLISWKLSDWGFPEKTSGFDSTTKPTECVYK